MILSGRAQGKFTILNFRFRTKSLTQKIAMLKPNRASVIRSTCPHDRRASAFELGQLAAGGHLHLELAVAASHNRTIWIWLIECAQEPTAPGAPPAAGLDMAAGPAQRRHTACLRKRIGIDDIGAEIEQEIEWRAGSRPINARLYRRTRRYPHGRHAAAAAPRRQARHRAHQRLPDRNRIGTRKTMPQTPANTRRR